MIKIFGYWPSNAIYYIQQIAHIVFSPEITLIFLVSKNKLLPVRWRREVFQHSNDKLKEDLCIMKLISVTSNYFKIL